VKPHIIVCFGFLKLQKGSKMDIRRAEHIKCSAGLKKDCGMCESCILQRKVSLTQEWLPRISETKKQVYIRSLLHKCSSVEMISSLIRILEPLQHKDFIYAKSKCNATFDKDLINVTNLSDRSMNIETVEIYMQEDRNWFSSATSWAKFNYLLNIMQSCNSFTLENIAAHLRKQYNSQRKHILNGSHRRVEVGDCSANAEINIDEEKTQVSSGGQSSILKIPVSPVNVNEGSTRHLLSAFTGSETYAVNASDNLSTFDDTFTLRSTPVAHQSTVGRLQKGHTQLSARCYPFVREQLPVRYKSEIEMNDSECYISCIADDFTDNDLKHSHTDLYKVISKQQDFIRRLPVHLSKYILGFLDNHSIINCICVSKHWRMLAEEVKNELKLQGLTKDDIMLIQGSTESIPNPVYARIIPIHTPKLTKDGEYILNDQAKHIDVTSEEEDFEDRNMQDCYDGIETETVNMEARNVFCGAYNVLILNNVKDPSRVTYYNGGNYVPVASIDRRIRLLDVKSGKCEKTIVEHVGSVKSVYTDESRGFVLSGSYDTTIRFWDIRSGRCQKIFLGHKSSVITLSLTKKYLATGSTDKTCKVWNLKTGKCVRTFKHRFIIHSVSISENLLLTGCASGKVRVWDFKKAKLIKSLEGHLGPITCTKLDEYHIATGSKDCYAMLWSAKGNYNRCLQAFRHFKDVSCLAMMFCRIVTGSLDGKIRVWNLLNGDCLRIIRGNSRNDPITALFASEHRLIINTKTNLLMYNFESVDWDYSAPVERESDFVRKKSSSLDPRHHHNHAFARAQSAMRKGTDLVGSRNVKNCHLGERNTRVQSAPIRKTDSQGIQKHISRIQSAVSTRNQVNNKNGVKNGSANFSMQQDLKQVLTTDPRVIRFRKEERVKSAWGNVPEVGLVNERSELLHQNKIPEYETQRCRVVARSRSAPAHRVRALPPNERGLTTSSNVNVKVWENKLNFKAPGESKAKARPFSASVAAMQHPVDTYSDLKLRTFYQQMQFESVLAGRD